MSVGLIVKEFVVCTLNDGWKTAGGGCNQESPWDIHMFFFAGKLAGWPAKAMLAGNV
jgi:hypothetical protein